MVMEGPERMRPFVHSNRIQDSYSILGGYSRRHPLAPARIRSPGGATFSSPGRKPGVAGIKSSGAPEGRHILAPGVSPGLPQPEANTCNHLKL